jgi:hypothetical protein
MAHGQLGSKERNHLEAKPKNKYLKTVKRQRKGVVFQFTEAGTPIVFL